MSKTKSGSKKDKSYRQLSEELTELLEWFEDRDLDLEEATVKYEQAVKVLEQMESSLKSAENKIRKITGRFQ